MLTQQIQRLDINDPALCLSLFKSNREAGLAIACAIAVGRWRFGI
jgi:4-hydroxybenzoate polyprenyltransferase